MKIKWLILICALVLCGCDEYTKREEVEKHLDVCLEDEIGKVSCYDIFQSVNCSVACYPKTEKVNKCLEIVTKNTNDSEDIYKIIEECNKPIMRWNR